MKNIGIIGSGIAGLQLALFLQKHGINPTLYSDKTPDQIRACRLTNTVARFHTTRNRERALGVEHWDFPDFGMFGGYMYIGGEQPIIWSGSLKQPASPVDMRVYQSALLEDFEARGGKVVFGEVQADDVDKLSGQHDLMVVASGRASLTEMFPRDPERSPYTEPQRLITVGIYKGLDLPDPLGLVNTVSPGNGEIVQLPFITFNEQRVSTLLIEAIPGGAFEAIYYMRYEDNPEKFNATVLDLLNKHSPPIYEKVNPMEFGVLRPLDVGQGAITPTVRFGYKALSNGKFALALGDVHIQNDPILGQGANAASKSAWILGEVLLQDQPLDENFCRRTEQQLWEATRAATEWTNMTLQPPPQHVVDLFTAASQHKEIADELIENFTAPERNLAILSDPDCVEKLLEKYSLQSSKAVN